MFFAAEDTATGVGIGVMISGVVAAVGAVIHAFIKNRHDQHREARKDAIDEWKQTADNLRQQLDRYDAALRESQEVVQAVWRAEANCRTLLAEARTCIKFLYLQLKSFHARFRELGHDPGDMPELPPMSDPAHATTEMEYKARQASHSASLVQQAGSVVRGDPAKPQA